MLQPPAAWMVSASGQPERRQQIVDQLPLGHGEAGVLGTQPLRASSQMTKWLVRHSANGVEERLVDLDRRVRARLVDVGMLEEHGGRQDDVGHAGRVGQELLVHRHEQVVPREAAVHLAEVGGDAHRVGVLDQQRVDRPAAGQRLGLARQDRADLRLVELRGRC